ncbi:hypothetical protein GCM10022290_09680 [Sagittula marina]
MTAAGFQSSIEGLITEAIWDGVSREAIAAILAAQAEVQKHKR